MVCIKTSKISSEVLKNTSKIIRKTGFFYKESEKTIDL